MRSYGMSYAGLLSFVYAEMDSKDPRVVAVKDWLTQHYTIEETLVWVHKAFSTIIILCQKLVPFWNHGYRK